MAKTAKSFEESLSRLEEIVRILEGGTATLDESLKLYEEGIALVRTCNAKLDGAEKKIMLLGKNAEGEIEVGDFSDE